MPMTICKARHQRAPFTVDDGHIIGLRNRQRLFRYLFDEVSFNQNILLEPFFGYTIKYLYIGKKCNGFWLFLRE